MVRIQTNLKNFSIVKELNEIFSLSDLPYQLYITGDGSILPEIRCCPLCDCDLSKNGYNECKDKRAKAFGLKFRKGRVSCPNPNCPFQLNIPHKVLNQWFSRFSSWIESIILSLGTKKVSAPKIAQHLKETEGLCVSDEYIRVKLQKLMNNVQQPMPREKPSGIVIHDEQFVKIKGIDLKRISTVDANNPNVYYDKLHLDRTEETMVAVCCELKKLVDEIYAVVLDGHAASKKAYERMFVGILIQYCLFHFAKNVRDAYKEEVGYGKGKSCLPVDHLIGFFSILNIFFDHERELNKLQELQKQLRGHIERINKCNLPLAKQQEYIEDCKKQYASKAAQYLHQIRKVRRRKNGIKLTLRTEAQARQLLEKAKQENVFPKGVQKQVNRLERDWKNFTHCMRDPSIPATTNKLEQYYALTLDWIEKNNLQSPEQFYQTQKFSLIRRYNIPLFRQGIFTDFLKTTFALLLTFGRT